MNYNPASYTALWAAVLVQSVRDMDSSEGKGLEELRAKRYIFDDRKGVGSFWWICEMLDLDYNRLQVMCLSREGRKRLLKPQYNYLEAAE